MKTMYAIAANRLWLALIGVISLTLSAQAQSTTPPVLQWQRVIEGGIDFSSTIYAAKSTTAEFGILTGTTLTRLTASGAVKWSSAVEGSVLTSSNPLTYSTALRTSGLVPTPDGGFLVQANDAVNLYLLKKDANGNRIWSKIIMPSIDGSTTESYSGLDLIQTPDGGYLSFATHRLQGYEVRTLVSKFNGDGNLVSSQEPNATAFSPPPFQGPAGRVVYRRLALPDGGYIQVGDDGVTLRRPNPDLPFAERFDAQGNRIWSRLYQSASFYDIIPNPDGSNSFILISVVGPILMMPNGDLSGNLGNAPINAAGNLRRMSIASDGTGQPFFVTLNESRTNRDNFSGDFQLNGYNQQNQVAWTRTLGGSSIDSPQELLTTGDGYLLVGTTNSTDGDVQGKQGNALATWVVKLSKTATLFTLTQPTYNCQTGAITFNTTGGDGSPITYSAPGIARSSASSNTGTVEQGLRNDPKPLTITATQNGVSVTYTFDFKGYCSSNPVPKPPLSSPIPDQFYTVGQSVNFPVGSFFSDPTTGIPGYNPNWSFSLDGLLPDGLSIFSRNDFGSPNPTVAIVGTPRTTGVYTMTVTASTEPFRNNPIRTTFKITVSATGQPGGPLAQTQPTYNCTTGAITFNTTGGDGSPITFSAPGISRSSVTSNSGTVEQGLRNDPKPLTITAMQGGQAATYVFDFKTYCANPQPPTPPVGSALALLAPTYDCATGAITFRSSGGNASPVEYASPGITDWTTNPNQFVDKGSRTANDVKPFTLMARQNGVVVTYIWDLKAACGRGVSARLGAAEQATKLNVVVLGNPIEGRSAEVEIGGVAGQAVHLDLIDIQGRMIHQQRIEQAGATERIIVPTGDSRGGTVAECEHGHAAATGEVAEAISHSFHRLSGPNLTQVRA